MLVPFGHEFLLESGLHFARFNSLGRTTAAFCHGENFFHAGLYWVRRQWPLDSATLEQFKQELPSVYKQVLARAVRIVRAKRQGWDCALPEGQEAADLVQEAVEKVLRGERQWDPISVPDLHVFLTGVVRSLASHLVTGGSSREVTVDGVGEYIDHNSDSPLVPTAETVLIEAERCDEIMCEAFAAAGEDAVIQKMLDAIMEGYMKADEIAELSGLSLAEVYEGNRRLHRRMKSVDQMKRRRL